MFRQKRKRFLSLAIFLAVFVAAIMPLSALAQDEVPPQPDAPVVVEEDTVTEESVVDEPTAEEPAVEEMVVSEILEQLPEDTTLVVVDEDGEALPLVSTEAAEILTAPDPFFTVGGTTYRFFGAAGACGGEPDCWDGSATPIQDAIDYLSTTLKTRPTDGNIYVESGAYIEDVFLNGSAWTTAGGDIPDYLGIIGAGSGVGGTTLNGSFYITGMNAFTLSGLTVNADGGDAIYVDSQEGALELTDLEVVNIAEESAGIWVWSNHGDVNLTHVSSTTKGIGLRIVADDGNVNLDNVDISGNLYDGANVNIMNGNLTVQGSNFSANGYGGLIAMASGDITLESVKALDNIEAVGLSLNSSGNVTLKDTTSTGNGIGVVIVAPVGNVFIEGGDFSENFNGIAIYGGAGSVILKNVIASNNSNYGAGIVNTIEDVDVLCGAYTGNGKYGLTLNVDGNAYLGGPDLSGNTEGEYELLGGTVSFGLCDQPTQNNNNEEGGERGFKPQSDQTGDAPVCSGEKKVVLKAGDAFGEYENLCDVDFQLKEVTENNLHGELPSGATQLGSLDAQVTSGGTAQGQLPPGGKITLKFPIPDGAKEASLAVLFWNGSAWVEVPGGKVVDGFFVVTVEKPGNYMLVS